MSTSPAPAQPSRDAGRLEKSLSGILEMPVSRLHNRLIPATDPEIIGYVTAIGMALQTQPNGLGADISWSPMKEAERRARQSKMIKQRVSILGAAAVLVLTVMYAQALVARHAAEDKKTIAANNDLKKSKASLAIVQKQHDKLAAFDTELDKGLDRQHGTVDIVVALHSALPPTSDLWLTQLSYARAVPPDTRGGLITMRGESKNSIAPTDLVIALQSCGAFKDVKLGYIGDAQATNLVAAPAAPAKAVEETPAEPAAPLPGFPAAGNPASPNSSGFPGFQPGFPQGGPNGFPRGGSQGFPRGGFPGSQPGDQPGAQPGVQPNFQFIPPTPGSQDGGGQPPQPIPIIIAPSPQASNPQEPNRTTAKSIVINPDKPADLTPSDSSRSAKAKPRQRPNRGDGSVFSSPAGVAPATAAYRMTVAPQTRMNSTVTTPRRASSIQVRKPTTGVVKPPGSNKVTRTSFIITCRVNQNSADLLAGLTLTTPKSTSTGNGAAKTKKHVISGDSESSDDTGESDAN